MSKEPKNSNLQHIDLSLREADDLLARLDNCNLPKKDRQLLKTIVNTYFWLQTKLQQSKLSLKTLKSYLFGFKSEKMKLVAPNNNFKNNTEDNETKEETSDEASYYNSNDKGLDSQQMIDSDEARVDEGNAQRPKVKGHGRNGADKYNGKKIIVEHTSLRSGDQCPEADCTGKIYNIAPSVVVRLNSNGLIYSTNYELTSLRCSLCSKIFRAQLPKEASNKKYNYQTISWLSFFKYYASLPFKRIETIQDLAGVPLADATQWDLIKELWEIAAVIYSKLIDLSAQGDIIHADDTRCQILSLEESDTKKRKGQYTTGIVSRFEDKTIYLYMSGRCYAGENMGKVLSRRIKDDKLIYMADASSMNKLSKVSEGLISKLIIIYCLVHARRKFLRIIEIFDDEVRYVLKLIGELYENEGYCIKNNLTAVERLEYHKEKSVSILEEWHNWMLEQIEEKKVEPNGSLGKAINYVLKRWPELTQFTRVAGAPLDNNIVERALRIPIRLRKSAYFYRTSKGALVGDGIMSIIYTCIAAKQNPIEYCTALQVNQEAVKVMPEAWLPWNFKEQMSLASNNAMAA